SGVAAPPVPYSCAVCGRRFPTRPDLTRHFRQLHQRERNKKLSRLRSLKGKKRQKFRERFISGNTKYDDAARELLTPKVGYGLASELRRAGVHVRTVSDKPQAADHALKRQVKHSVACGVDWLVLVSDDSDFTDTVRKARAADLRTVVVGDGCRALGSVADIWLPWDRVENGEVDEQMLQNGAHMGFRDEEKEEQDDDEFTVDWDTSDLDGVVDDIVATRTKLFGAATMSAFADEEIMDGILGVGINGVDMLWSSDDEDEDGYF
uniref:C2H2-type domain-containing protein n=2 Tax=Oryza brachyantha TaxID=4533 RepID=J3MBL4_ORYBR